MSELFSTEAGQGRSGKRFEVFCAITLALFAALLTITDLGGSKYGDDEIMGTNEKANIFAWYQSKSIKQSLVEGQRDLVRTLMGSGAINPEHLASLERLSAKLEEEINRYKMEKRELLLGSAAVGRENWIQDVEGELGKVVGAKEWEKKLETLGRAGDKFDLSVLFLQLCLVVGAVSLVLEQNNLKWTFYAIMVLLGLSGLFYSIQAFWVASSAG